MMPSVTIDEQLKRELSGTSVLRDANGRAVGVFVMLAEYAEMLDKVAEWEWETGLVKKPTVIDAKTLEGYVTSEQLLADIQQIKDSRQASR
jgi:hypothetical protein